MILLASKTSKENRATWLQYRQLRFNCVRSKDNMPIDCERFCNGVSRDSAQWAIAHKKVGNSVEIIF